MAFEDSVHRCEYLIDDLTFAGHALLDVVTIAHEGLSTAFRRAGWRAGASLRADDEAKTGAAPAKATA